MSPSRDVHVQIRILAITGLAECTVCGQLLSFNVPIEQAERLPELRCARCGGSTLPLEGTMLALFRSAVVDAPVPEGRRDG